MYTNTNRTDSSHFFSRVGYITYRKRRANRNAPTTDETGLRLYLNIVNKKSTGMARRRNEKTSGQSGSFCKRAHITHPEQLMKKEREKDRQQTIR